MSKAVAIPGCNKDIGGMRDEISLSPTEKSEGPIGLFSRLLRFDSLSKKGSISGSPTSAEPAQTYYGVYIPCEIKKGPDEEALHVYKNKSEALELVRRYKLARFKAFQNRQDAISFALRGADVENHEPDNSLMGEKPYPFKAPSPQEMVALRKSIEAGLATTVRDRIWDNPRFLVSSGNTPAIMQEGSRYNALHVAAKAMNAEMCDLILTTVGNPAFVQTLYGGDADDECCKEFSQILVDRYLNTPDKAMNETPLHFAAKFGAEQAVDVLTSFPQCDKTAVNKYGETPKDVICKRSDAGTPHTVRRIQALLEERFYVPVVHSEDGSSLPTVGAPFTPADPPELNRDPLSPRHEIRAFAGPMAARDAEHFRRRWRTPPRHHVRPSALRLRDLAKGLEHVGRTLAEEMKVGWKEYWPFLDTFTDLRSAEGLALLENYLKKKYETACSYAYSDSCAELQPSPEDLSLSRISLNLSQMSPPKDPNMSPMSELCSAMKTCTISSDRPAHWRKTDPIRQRMCRQPSKLSSFTNGDASPTTNHTVSQLLCIERTCQVFAKRIADALIFSLTAEPEVAGESLKSEAKHLQHTIYTYMDDERFQSINFALIHSRLAQLVVFKLKQQTKDLDDINHLIEFLMKLRCPNDDIFSSDDERKPVFRGPVRVKITHVIDCHVRCLASFVSEELIENDVMKGPSISEGECTEIWDKAAKCRCEWKIECFERNSKKNASFRKNRSILSTSPKSESFIKRLTFDHEIGDGKSQNKECERTASMNSPGGDSAPAALYTVDVDKCRVVDAEISEDDSAGSVHSDDEEAYHTASESETPRAERQRERDDDSGDMHDASDRALAEPFIYGEEPSKMDRLVFDAIAACEIAPSDYPHVYRWRHTVALHSPNEREKWPQILPTLDDSSIASPITYTLNLGHTPPSVHSGVRGRRSLRELRQSSSIDRCSTPKKGEGSSVLNDSSGRSLPLQVSNWLRVTGPNSPRSSSATKNLGKNVSFGF